MIEISLSASHNYERILKAENTLPMSFACLTSQSKFPLSRF